MQLSQRIKSKKKIDKLEQIDALTFSDEAAKLFSFVEHKQQVILFMLNQKRLSKQTKPRIFSIKLSFKLKEDASQLAFSYVTEVLGQLEPTFQT